MPHCARFPSGPIFQCCYATQLLHSAICSHHLRCMRKNTMPSIAAVRHVTHISRCMKPSSRTPLHHHCFISLSETRVLVYHRSSCVLSSLVLRALIASLIVDCLLSSLLVLFLSHFSSFLSLVTLVPHHFFLSRLLDIASLIATCRCTVSTPLPHSTIRNRTCTDIHACHNIHVDLQCLLQSLTLCPTG